ncbi:unnamed protein product, partial [Owenia fusiformis]
EEDKEELLGSWPEEAFNNRGNLIHVHEPNSNYRCIVKNVNPLFSDSTIEELITAQTGITNTVRRLTYTDTGKPMPVISVTCNSRSDLNDLLCKNIIIDNKTCNLKVHISAKNR